MNNHPFRFLSLALFALVLALGSSASALRAATIVIQNNDGAGEGFNDPTPAAPVGGNPGTTLGAQRLNAFQFAANIWGGTLTSSITIIVQAQFDPQTCTATSAVLGSAGADGIFRDFSGAPFAGTWYSEALANKLSGVDQEGDHDINATFNSNLGQPGCLDGTFFYLGLDNNHGSNIDLVTVLLHEFAHGLGFQTFTSGSSGALNGGFPTIYDRFLLNIDNGKSWLQMSNAERAASAINPHKLGWDGPNVSLDVPSVTSFGVPILTINTPPVIAGDYSVSTANFGPPVTAPGFTGAIIQALDPADVPGPTTTDGCSPFTNAGAVSGNIALIDRGTCTFKTKALNAQNAGAIGVVLVNNVAGAPPTMADDATITTPITISTVQVTLADGDLIKGQLGTGVNATVTTDPDGGDPLGKALMFTPNPFSGGSSVSHFDTIAAPNLLMEPNISGDLTHTVTPPSDLSFSQMEDIGWVATALPNTIAVTAGNDQTAFVNTAFPIPFTVTITPAVAGLTVTFTANASPGGANGTFAGTGIRYANATTNGAGVATAPVFTANGTTGDYSVNATVPGAGTALFSVHNTDGSTPTPTATPTATPTPTPTATPTPTPTPSPTPTPTPSSTPAAQAINLSTRMFVQTDDNVAIGGFIITGTGTKNVLLRAIGPSLSSVIPAALSDTVLELHGAGGFITVINNDWRDDPAQEILIEATGIPPTNDLESAIFATLPAGTYTGIIKGFANATGVGLIEIYDLDIAGTTKLANIATRAFVQTGDNIVIAGFILGGGSASDNVIVRGLGPVLSGVLSPFLANPTLELRNNSGALLIANDDWQDDPVQAAIIAAAGLAPGDALESAVAATLPPGNYTALLAGVNGGTGNGLVEVYDLGGGPFASPTPPGTPSPTPPSSPTPPASPTPSPAGPCVENFDGQAGLPPGWTATIDVGPPPNWAIVTNLSDTAPNNAFVSDTAVVSDKRLESRPIAINSAAAQISFRNNYDFEFSEGTYWDGGVLEASINGGPFVDVTDLSVSNGTFVSGGYNGSLDNGDNPLAGQMAWASSSAGYITSTINLNASLQGQSIVLRWRCGTDLFVGAPGWHVDSLIVTGASCPPP